MRPDLSDLKALMDDGKAFALMGLVAKPTSGPHWRKVEGKNGRTDILVEVETAPLGYDLTCRLTSEAGGAGMGLWRVPAVGTEVLVVIPDGEIDFMPTIAKVYSSGSVPTRASDQRTVMVAPDAIEVQAPLVTIGPDAASDTQGVVVASNSVKLGGSAASERIIKGDSRKEAEDYFLDLVKAAASEVVAGFGTLSLPATANAALVAAVDTYKDALEFALSSVSKTR